MKTATVTRPAFLNGGGEHAGLIAAHRWEDTWLGRIDRWPSHVRNTVSLMLRCDVPMVALFGEPGVMIYNDAFLVFVGGWFSQLLGSPVREGWPEVADFNDNVMRVGLAGRTLTYKDQELTLYRSGIPEQVWMNLDYSPVLDEHGVPAAVLAIVVETTAKVQAERALQEANRRKDEFLAMLALLLRIPSAPISTSCALHSRSPADVSNLRTASVVFGPRA